MPCSRGQQIDLARFAVDPRDPAWAEFRDHFPRCPECSREVARFAALKETLAGEAAGTSGHPSPRQIAALASASAGLAAEERARLEAHLAGCAPCRTELAVVRGSGSAQPAPAPPGSGWADWIRGALTAALWRPAFVAAALVLLAVPVAFLIWRRANETPAPPSPPIAQAERPAPITEPPAPPRPAPEPPPQPPIVAQVPEPKPGPTATVPRASSPASAPAAPPEPAEIAKRPAAEKPTPAPGSAPAPAPEIEIAALLPAELPRYAPGALASGPSVRVGGMARSLGAAGPVPEALGPAHVGASAHESPNLYWFLPEATPLSVEVTVVDPDADAPVLETTVPGPIAAGVHRVSLAKHGARLAPSTDYRWFVALVRDPDRRSQDLVSGAAIRYAPPSREQRARLAAAEPARLAHVYAQSGLWYDAFDQLSTWLAAERGAARLREHRAALLDQVGLADASAFERAQSQLPINRKGAQ